MKLIFLFCLLLINHTFAGVHLRNGNFFVTYTDLSATQKGTVLELSRTYNSKSTYKGWFGYGWGTPFEVRLETSPDGSIVIFENGSGAFNRFVPGKISEANVSQVIESIVAAVKKSKAMTNETEKSLRDSLKKDDYYRHKIAQKYGVVAKHNIGEKLISEDFGGQEVEVTGEGYSRNATNGINQYFNKEGVITKTRNQAGYGLDFSYNKSGQVSKVLDTFGNQFTFEWNSDNTVKSVVSQDKKKAQYSYSNENLTKITDADNITFLYDYDSNHNITKLTDTSLKNVKSDSIIVEYDPKTFNATKVTNRDGSVNTYYYEFNPKRPKEETTTIVTRKDPSGPEVAEKYLYDYRKRTDGSEWLARAQTITDGKYDPKTKKFTEGFVEDSFYAESSPYPVKKIEGQKEVNYTYTSDGLLATKVLKFQGKVVEKAQYKYDPKFKKINYVKTDKSEYNYEYNTKGDLTKALDKKGNAILFVYDLEGRISKMYEKNKSSSKPRTLQFTYNTKGKPTVVDLEGVGKLSITYDSQTESKVEDIKSSKGLEVYNQVREVFDNFMDVVKPTGININL